MYIVRTAETILKRCLDQFPATAVTGPRQTGKSTLLKKALPHFKYCTLDDLAVRKEATEAPEKLLDRLGEPLILDEIQYAPELLTNIKVRIDNDRAKCGRFVVTGSQQFPLMKGLGDSLAGRVAIFELMPFDVNESESPELRKGKNRSTRSLFADACLKGSYPEPCINEGMERALWYTEYLRTYIERDVRAFSNIHLVRDFERFLYVCAARCGNLVNYADMSRSLGVDVNTVRNWVSVLEASRIVFLLTPYFQNVTKRFVKAPKLYFTDCGLLSHLLGITDETQLMENPLAGALFENFCVQEALKTYLHRGKMPRMFFFRSRTGVEVDMLVSGPGLSLYPIEFKLTDKPKSADADGVRSYLGLNPKSDIRSGQIVCLSETGGPLTKDSAVVPFRDYIRWLETVV